MGKKIPGSVKCRYCPATLLSVDSLQSHHSAVHADNKRITRAKLKSNGNTDSPDENIMKKARSSKIPGSKVNVLSLPLEKDRSQSPPDFTSRDVRKVEFKCPKCEKFYPTYFSCLRHIQKYHCFNTKNQKVKPDDPSLVKPIRTEMCVHCNTKVKCSEYHQCSNTEVKNFFASSYICLGCKQSFSTMKLYEIHVSGLHNNGVQSFFFPNSKVFNTWKEAMEKETKCSYTLVCLNRNKQIFRCSNYKEDEESNTVHLCPSTLIFQEFTKGIQTHFFKEHAGHNHKEYILKDQYKPHLISDLLINQKLDCDTNDEEETDSLDDNPYIQFRNIMQSILLESEQVDIATLRCLTIHAVKMSEILKHFNEHDCAHKSLDTNANENGIEIKEEIETPKKDTKSTLKSKKSASKTGKKVNETPAKRSRSNIETPTEASAPKPKRNKFSLADEKDSDNILKELGDNNVKKTKSTSSLGSMQSPSSFNDSYKDFIDKTLSIKGSPNTVKQSPQTIKESPSTDKNKTKPLKVYAGKKKKNIVKTKIGQFTPNSPKSPRSMNKVKMADVSPVVIKDIKYEVKERNDDCNILILKI